MSTPFRCLLGSTPKDTAFLESLCEGLFLEKPILVFQSPALPETEAHTSLPFSELYQLFIETPGHLG